MASTAWKGWLGSLLAGLLLSGCNPWVVQPDRDLHRNVGRDYYLARPLSGPGYRSANVYGPRAIPAGTPVTVVSIERPPKGFDVHPMGYEFPGRIYRIYFVAPGVCERKPCMAHWRAEDDAHLQARFDRVFVTEDPLLKVDRERRPFVATHKVASWMTPEEVKLSIGEPNFVTSSFGLDYWVYEYRHCDWYGRLISQPVLTFIFEGDELRDYAQLSRGDWYLAREPYGQENVCAATMSRLDAPFLPPPACHGISCRFF